MSRDVMLYQYRLTLQVDQLATSKGLILAGYYLANENINDLRYLDAS